MLYVKQMVNNVLTKQSPVKDFIVMPLTPKEAKQIETQRKVLFGKYEVQIEDGQPTRMVNIRESILL